VIIDQDSSGDVRVTDVGGSVELLADGSGQVLVTDVKGTVRLPRRGTDRGTGRRNERTPGPVAVQRISASSRSIIRAACAR
jgi:hypothetical protein